MSAQRFNFLNVKISAEDLSTATIKVLNYSFQKSDYICFPDASVVTAANKDPFLLDILNNSFLTLPDGKPSQLAAKLQGFKSVSTVSGYYLMKNLLNSELTHYFYGGNEQVLEKMKANLNSNFPHAKVLGFKAPPFVPVGEIQSNHQITDDMEQIKELSPDIVWIGISSPKQDYLMHYHHARFEHSLLLGVGGVFLYWSDESLKSPEWIKKMGMRWAYRLSKEPKRLGPKYYETILFLVKNLGFFIKSALYKA